MTAYIGKSALADRMELWKGYLMGVENQEVLFQYS